MEKIIVAIGGTGRLAAERLLHSRSEAPLRILYLDTDGADVARTVLSDGLCVSTGADLFSIVLSMEEELKQYFGLEKKDFCSVLGTATTDGSTGGWRMRALLAFLDFIAAEEYRSVFLNCLEPFFNTEQPYELVVLSSLAGGAGSTLPLPVSLFLNACLVRRFGKGFERIRFFFAAPEMFAFQFSPQQMERAEANACAALQEYAPEKYDAAVRAFLHFTAKALGCAGDDVSDFVPVHPEIVLAERVPGDTSREEVLRSYVQTVSLYLRGLTGEEKSLLSSVSCRSAAYSPDYAMHYISAAQTAEEIRLNGTPESNAEQFLLSALKEKMNAGKYSSGSVLTVNGTEEQYVSLFRKYRYLHKDSDPCAESADTFSVFYRKDASDDQLESVFSERMRKNLSDVKSVFTADTVPQTVISAILQSSDAEERNTFHVLLQSCRALTGLVSHLGIRPTKTLLLSRQNALAFFPQTEDLREDDELERTISEQIIFRKENIIVNVKISELSDQNLYVLDTLDCLDFHNLSVLQPGIGKWYRSAEKLAEASKRQNSIAISPFLFSVNA